MRRDKLNNYVSEIAGIVPMGSGGNKRIDKTSILRLAANYIRMHKILKDEEEDESVKMPPNLGQEITHSLAEAIGGFLLVVTSSGKVVYITEAVDQFFSHTQVDLLGHSIYNVIHPDDHEIFQQQLIPKDNCRRSFFCRMMKKALCRNDPGQYEIIHVVGQLKALPQMAASSSSSLSTCSIPSPRTPFSEEGNTSSDYDDDDASDNDSETSPVKAVSRTGTHIMISFVRVVKDRPITELSLVESTQEEYITRHGMDGKILYTDHRISFVTGLMPSEVVGTSAFNYMHHDDVVWSIVAQKLMFTSTQGQGIISYRLKCRDGVHVTLRSRGFLEVNKQTGQVDSFVCINTVVSTKEANQEIKNQRRKLLPVISSHDTEEHLGSITSALPPELLMVLKQISNPETMRKMIEAAKKDELSIEVESAGAGKILSMDAGSSTGKPIPESQQDSMRDTNHGCNSNPFQTKAKRHCSDASSCDEEPEGITRVDQWQSLGKKRPCVDSYSSSTCKKLNFEMGLPCPESFHSNYMPDKFNQQFSPNMAPLPTLSPTTSLVPETAQNYAMGSFQPHSSAVLNRDNNKSVSYSANSNVVQNCNRPVNQVSCWQSDIPPALSRSNNYDPSVCASQKNIHNLAYCPRLPSDLPTSPSYDQRKEGSVSPGSSRPVNETAYMLGHQNRMGSVSPSGNIHQNRCNNMSPFVNHNDGIGTNLQVTSPCGISPTNYPQSSCQSLSGRGYNHGENHSSQHFNSPKDQQPALQQSHHFSQYPKASPSSPYTMNPLHYQNPISAENHVFTPQTSPNANLDHCSDFSPQQQRQNIQAKSTFVTQASGSTSTNYNFSGIRISVPEPAIPAQQSLRDDFATKEESLFSNGSFQHYPTTNQQGGKML